MQFILNNTARLLIITTNVAHSNHMFRYVFAGDDRKRLKEQNLRKKIS